MSGAWIVQVPDYGCLTSASDPPTPAASGLLRRLEDWRPAPHGCRVASGEGPQRPFGRARMLRTLRPRSVYDILAAIAFFIAVAGGSAYAAATIGSGDKIGRAHV